MKPELKNYLICLTGEVNRKKATKKSRIKLSKRFFQPFRNGNEDVAMITADELSGILETAHLLRSPANAKRLLATLERVKNDSGTHQTIEALRKEVGFEQTPD